MRSSCRPGRAPHRQRQARPERVHAQPARVLAVHDQPRAVRQPRRGQAWSPASRDLDLGAVPAVAEVAAQVLQRLRLLDRPPAVAGGALGGGAASPRERRQRRGGGMAGAAGSRAQIRPPRREVVERRDPALVGLQRGIPPVPVPSISRSGPAHEPAGPDRPPALGARLSQQHDRRRAVAGARAHARRAASAIQERSVSFEVLRVEIRV
ncbi:MAG: hypothetical protein IPO81_18660 [Kouleothrix sp.]|nr:hypothetical protein [Kouleothrix sp.]